MKLISALLIIAIMFGACASRKDPKTVIENYFKSKADDPSSYQTVEIKLLDTLDDVKSMKLFLHDFKKMTERDALHKDSVVKAYNTYLTSSDTTMISSIRYEATKATENLRADSNVISDTQHKLDSLSNSKSKNSFQLKYLNKMRSKNAFGALVLQSYYVYLDDTLGVVKIEDVDKHSY